MAPGAARKRRFTRHGRAERYSAERYTPALYAEAARRVLGSIHLDPASAPAANRFVGAERFYTQADNGLARPWGGAVFCNAPNNRAGTLIKAFWHRANEHAVLGGPGAVVLWVGFSLEQLRTLQHVAALADGTACPSPQDWPRVYVAERISWIDGETRKPLPSPPQANYFALVGGTGAQRRRFRRVFGAFGKYVHGTRAPTSPGPGELDAEVFDTVAAGPMSASALARALGARKATVLAAVARLLEGGVLERVGAGPTARLRLRQRRPSTRAECGTERPCPWVGCRYHLALTVRRDGAIQPWAAARGPGRPAALPAGVTNAQARERLEDAVLAALETMPATCALDEAAAGPTPLRRIGELAGCGESSARQSLGSALDVLSRTLR